MTIGHVSVNTTLPLLPLQGFGTVGSETAAICLAVGTMCFIPRMLTGTGPTSARAGAGPGVVARRPGQSARRPGQRRRSWAVLVRGAPLRTSARVPAAASTSGRANWCWPSWPFIADRSPSSWCRPPLDRKPVQIPLASTFHSLFHSQGKAESAQDRLNLASEAEKLIPQHPVIGWGLGVEFPFYETGTRTVDDDGLCTRHRARSPAAPRHHRPAPVLSRSWLRSWVVCRSGGDIPIPRRPAWRWPCWPSWPDFSPRVFSSRFSTNIGSPRCSA